MAWGHILSVFKHYSNVFFKYLILPEASIKCSQYSYYILLWSLPQNVFWKQLGMLYCMALIESSLKVYRLNSEKETAARQPCCSVHSHYWWLHHRTVWALQRCTFACTQSRYFFLLPAFLLPSVSVPFSTMFISHLSFILETSRNMHRSRATDLGSCIKK